MKKLIALAALWFALSAHACVGPGCAPPLIQEPCDADPPTMSGQDRQLCAISGKVYISNSGSWSLITGGGGGSGTVTNVGTGSGLTGGPISVSGTINIANVSATSHQWFDSVVANVFHKSQPACGDLSNSGTACTASTGTSGATIPLLNAANTWSALQSFNSGDLALKGATSGTLTVNAAATAGSNTLTLPAGTTDFSATGGTSQVVQQSSAGGALTVGQLALSNISGTIQASQWPTLTSNAFLTGGGAGAAPNAVALTGLVVGNGASAPTAYAGATCTNQFLSAIGISGAGTCTTATLSSAQFANQGTTTTLLHGNAAGNPSFAGVSNADLLGSIAASKLVGTDINTVGTISTGAWNGSTITVQYGGSGTATITGPIKGNGTSPFTAAASSDIYGLWSGTCNSSTFLRGDGACVTPAGGGTVNAGTTGQLAYYPGAGTTLSGETTFQAVNMPALTGDITTAGGALATTLATVATPGTNLKITYNAKGLVTSGTTAACSDLSNAAASCATDATVATNITSGTLPDARLANVISAGGPTGSSTVIPVITYDAHGRLTAVTTASVSGMTTFATAMVAAGGMASFGGL